MELLDGKHGAVVHRMSLNEEPFEKMLRGEKTIEVRCNDEKRQKIKADDIILFQLVNHKDKYIIAQVKALYPFQTFHELYSAFDFSEFGCTGYTMEQMLKETAEIYSAEKELKYGALGIRVEKIGGNEEWKDGIYPETVNGGEKMILYHASKEIVEYPEIRKTRYTKDFSWGFYCTKDLQQAIRWANRGAGEPIINIYRYEPDESLSILKFDEMTDSWLDFIAKCRSGETHSYDIVEGPMANDTVWNYVNDFLAGRLTRKQFWVLAEFRHPTHQMSFHTLSALNCLTYERSEVIHDRKGKE